MNVLDLTIATWPELAALRHLEGWRWQYGEGKGDLAEVGLCGFQQISPLWMDVLWIFGQDDAYGVRCMVNGPVTWTREGTVTEVLTAIAHVPRPGQPGAPLTAITVGLPVAEPQADALS